MYRTWHSCIEAHLGFCCTIGAFCLCGVVIGRLIQIWHESYLEKNIQRPCVPDDNYQLHNKIFCVIHSFGLAMPLWLCSRNSIFFQNWCLLPLLTVCELLSTTTDRDLFYVQWQCIIHSQEEEEKEEVEGKKANLYPFFKRTKSLFIR